MVDQQQREEHQRQSDQGIADQRQKHGGFREGVLLAAFQVDRSDRKGESAGEAVPLSLVKVGGECIADEEADADTTDRKGQQQVSE